MNSNNYLTAIEKVLAEKPLAEKTVIMPSFSVGRQIGESLARAGRAWVNLRFETLPSLALQAAGPLLAAEGLGSLSEAAARIRIHRILDELRGEGLLQYFSGLELRPGLIAALHLSIRELRADGVSSGDLLPERFFDPHKGRELALVLRRYEAALEENRVFDRADLYRAAISAADRNGSRPHRSYFCLDSQIFSALEKEFLSSLAGGRLHVLARGAVRGLSRPRLYLKLPSKKPRVFEPKTDLGRAPWLFALRNIPKPFEDGSLKMFHALGISSECREVLRRIIWDNTALDDVEILCPPGPRYPTHFFALASELALPLTLEDGIPASFTSPGRLFLGIIGWMESGYAEADLRTLLREGLLKLPKASSGPGLTAPGIIGVLRRAKIGGGLDRYAARLKALYEEVEGPEKGGPGRKKNTSEKQAATAETINRIRRWMAGALEFFPPWEGPGEREWGEVCARLSAFLKKNAMVSDRKDAEALGLLTLRLEETAAAGPPPALPDDILEWLRGAASFSVERSGPLPGKIHISSHERGGYSGRSAVFIVGVDQSAVPGLRLPDPILLDGERERVSEGLSLSTDRQRETLYAMTALLASLEGRVTLSYPAYDTLKERPIFPSSFLLQVHRLLRGDPELDYSSLFQGLGPPVGFIPDIPLDEREWWLHRIAPQGRIREALEAVRKEFKRINTGHEARMSRSSETAGSYDGLVDISSEDIHPCFNPEMRMSASRLENLARCPYGYFLRYVLGLEPPEETVIDRSVWLDPLQRGTLLHEIFWVFMEDLRERGERADPDKHGGEIRNLADRLISRYREEIPAPSEAVVERDRAEIYQSLDIFLRMERSRDEPVIPLLFEVTFGLGEKEEPVRLALGGDRFLQVAGRIDRIDRLEDGSFRVIDYKTGNPGGYEAVKCFGRGKYLQAALYALAAEEILRRRGIDSEARVRISGYAFPSKRGGGREILFKDIDRERLRNLISDLLLMLEAGQFVTNPHASCGYCDFVPLCGPEAVARAKEKKNGGSAAFDILGRLEEYE